MDRHLPPIGRLSRRHSPRPIRRTARRTAMTLVVAVLAALTVGVGAQPASASIGSTYSSHTLTLTITGYANISVICQGGNVFLIGGEAIAAAPCTDVQHIAINGDGAQQIVSLEGVTSAAF